MFKKITKSDITHILGLGSFFLVIVQNLWTFIETQDFLKGKFIWFVVFSFILAFIIYISFSFVRNRVLRDRHSYQINEKLNEYQSVVDKLDEKDKYYELITSKWRIEVELNKLDKINGGEWTIKALKTYEYLRYVFGKLLSLLKEGDTYTTLSNLDFWSKHRYGDTDFIAMNVIAAELGVQINRIIVIDSDIFKNPSMHNFEINTLKEVVNEFKNRFIPNTKAYQNTQNYFYLSDNYIDDIRPPYPFAIISNNKFKSKMAVLPSIIKDENNPNIDIKFLNKSTEMDFNINQARFDRLMNTSSNLMTPDAIKFKISHL